MLYGILHSDSSIPKAQMTTHLKLFQCSLNVRTCPSHVELRRESWWTIDFPYLQRIGGNMCASSQGMLRNLEKYPTCNAVSPWGFTNSLASCWNSLDLFRYLLDSVDSVVTQSALVLQSSHDKSVINPIKSTRNQWYLMTLMTVMTIHDCGASMPPSQCTNFSPIDLVRSSMAATASRHRHLRNT